MYDGDTSNLVNEVQPKQDNFRSYNEFLEAFKNYIEESPEDYSISNLDEALKDLGITEDNPRIIQTPIENIELRADRLEHIINGGGSKHLPDKSRFRSINKMIATLERPNIVIKFDNGKKEYLKIFKNSNKIKNQIVSIYNDENGDFVYTTMPIDKDKKYILNQLNRGSIVYKNGQTGVKNDSAANNIIPYSQDNFKPNIFPKSDSEAYYKKDFTNYVTFFNTSKELYYSENQKEKQDFVENVIKSLPMKNHIDTIDIKQSNQSFSTYIEVVYNSFERNAENQDLDEEQMPIYTIRVSDHLPTINVDDCDVYIYFNESKEDIRYKFNEYLLPKLTSDIEYAQIQQNNRNNKNNKTFADLFPLVQKNDNNPNIYLQTAYHGSPYNPPVNTDGTTVKNIFNPLDYDYINNQKNGQKVKLEFNPDLEAKKDKIVTPIELNAVKLEYKSNKKNDIQNAIKRKLFDYADGKPKPIEAVNKNTGLKVLINASTIDESTKELLAKTDKDFIATLLLNSKDIFENSEYIVSNDDIKNVNLQGKQKLLRYANVMRYNNEDYIVISTLKDNNTIPFVKVYHLGGYKNSGIETRNQNTSGSNTANISISDLSDFVKTRLIENYNNDYKNAFRNNNEFSQGNTNQEGTTNADLPRGYFQPNADGSNIIKILQSGDSSTIPHELAHFYLYNLEQLADKNKRAEKELNDILEYFGFTVDDLADPAKERALQESFATGFEVYLIEGTAPTKGLLRAFQNFKAWLKDIYKYAKELKTPDGEPIIFSEATQKLYDRIFTTDEEYEKEVLPKYQYNYKKALEIEEEKKKPSYIMKSALNESKNFISTWYDKLFLPLDTRLGKLSPELKNRLRHHTASFAAITGKDLKTENGKYVLVAIEADKNVGKGVILNDIRSIHSRNNYEPLIDNALNNKRLLKVDIDKIKDLLWGSSGIIPEGDKANLNVGSLKPHKADIISAGAASLLERIYQEQNNVKYYQSVYHGSPYDFDEFSLEHLGSGEGVQAHGWGLYFAENKDVSDEYRKNLTTTKEQREIDNLKKKYKI